MSRSAYLPSLVIATLCLIWGSTWIAIKFGLEDLPPFLFAGTRFFLATVLLFVFMKLQRIPFPTDREKWKVMLVLGAFQSIDYAAVFWAEQFIDSAVAAILFATMPFFVAGMSYFMMNDHRVTPSQLFGITVSFVGVVLIFLRDLAHISLSLKGDLAIIVGSLSGAFISVYAKKHAEKIHAVTNTTVQLGVAAVSLTTLGLITEDPSRFRLSFNAGLAISYLAIVGSAVAFVLYMWVIKKVTVMEASVITLCIPVVAILLGWLLRDEALGFNVLGGTSLILVGVYFVNVLDPERFRAFLGIPQASGKPPVPKICVEEEMHA
jgi:drug/metabolite transporter (DMT)-like permease